MNLKTHWEKIYELKNDTEMSWYQPLAENSMKLIEKAQIDEKAKIIDVGGGNSVLVKNLVDKGYSGITVLDISQNAIDRSKVQLGSESKQVEWFVGDIRETPLQQDHFDLWHDRAVFHFFTEEADRQLYLEQVNRSLKKDGFLVIAAFCLAGPEKCSGLPVRRYDPEILSRELGPKYELRELIQEPHHTPWGSEQCFIYALFRKTF
ncbi:MAG: class I SAM-dependent methyltransferase [Proteobacteria bacterium]|jgi:ubiquinone/menaquinone biosynthesis C-methylase UbiE|nr:class I SAM-dependent methyltransferase [Pseudomonadota bacterium]